MHVCMHACTWVCHRTCVEVRPHLKAVFHFCHWIFWYEAWVIRLIGKHLHLLSYLPGAELCLKVWSLEISLLALTLRRPGATGKLSHLKPMSPPLVIKTQKHGMLSMVSSQQQPSVPCAYPYLKLWLSHPFRLTLVPICYDCNFSEQKRCLN